MTYYLAELIGQSNAGGYLNNGPAPYEPTARVQIWTDTDGDGMGDAFHYMLPGVNTGTMANPTMWGPEVGTALAWLVKHPDPEDVLFLGKVTKGETGLAQAEGFDWSPLSHGELYDAATRVAHDMVANLAHPLDVVMVMQGETDATSAQAAGAYQANLTDLIAHVRADWGVSDVVLGRIGSAGAHSLDVRVAQWNVDALDDHVASFKTLDLATQPDGIHVADQMTLGARFYEGWMTL